MALVAQYLFQDNANDSSGNGYNGTATDVTYAQLPQTHSINGKAGIFNGSTSHIDLPTISQLAGTVAFSVEYWFQSPGTGIGAVLILGRAGNGGWESRLDANDGKLWSLIHGDIYKTFNFTKDNNWHHVVMTKAANATISQSMCYLDGVAISGTTSAVDTQVNITYTNSYAIGYRRNLSSYYYNGKLANVRLYNEVLSAATILEHYQTESSPPPSSAAALLLMLM